MKRFAAYDPPEYLDWTADPELLRQYRERIDADPERRAAIRALSQDGLLAIYAGLLRNRLHDVALKRWVKNGVISKAWLGTGEEAVTIGPVHALRRSGPDHDVVAPMIRNAGSCHEMGMPIAEIFRTYLGTADGPNGGRDLHVGDLRYGVLSPISNIGDVPPVISGIALSFLQRGQDRVGMTWIGDGSTKHAGIHEALNFAGVKRLPVIFIIQNNQVALGTRVAVHSAGAFDDWPAMYGLAGGRFDGNHVLDAYGAARVAADRARAGEGATLLVTDTFRMGGHATHDEREARSLFSADTFREWGKRDPVGMYEAWLEGEGIARDVLERIEAEVTAEVDAAAEEALKSRDAAMPAGESAELGVYAAA
ncbi:thiamine pyrophosphate-dependent enzyme [Longimicrobium sp.]|uniref:thiamine pyrophosphate-dependent enzyme n=1 Tax=Longimicrobium sp. TaxID=2029185 RepID=UPI002B68C70F|nr:thiamine pyrophosphate-dependent enzyme [Longimicrobium sp.]HSU15968.1 thiamine pyrophosphate-dependent enzyme [Longimicrobium sp.]